MYGYVVRCVRNTDDCFGMIVCCGQKGGKVYSVQNENRILGGRYRVIQVIGHGAAGSVYLTEDVALEKRWALKETEGAAWNEAALLKQLDYALFPYVIDVFEDSGKVYLVSEYVEGDTLETIKSIHSGCSGYTFDDVIKWGIQLAQGLSYLHHLQPPMIHQDVKPSNVMRKPDGQIKLIDFGIAIELREGVQREKAYGSYGYAAPEQFGDQNGCPLHAVDERTDIYGLGKTLQYLTECLPEHLKESRRRNALGRILMKCTQREPHLRYQSAEELVHALERLGGVKGRIGLHKYCKSQGYGARVVLGIGIAVLLICVWCALLAIGSDVNSMNAGNGGTQDDYLGHDTDAANDCENIDKLLYRAGYACFHEQRDYQEALRYFQCVSENVVPEVQFYQTICSNLTEFNEEDTELQRNLEEFMNYIDEQKQTPKQLETMLTLCSIYRMTNEEMQALLKVSTFLQGGLHEIKLLQAKAAGLDDRQEEGQEQEREQEFLRKLEDQYYLQLFAVNRQLGMEQGQDKRHYEEAALMYGERILSENQLTAEEAEVQFCQQAQLYAEIGLVDEALECYKEGELRLHYDSTLLYADYLTYLLQLYDIGEYENQEENRDVGGALEPTVNMLSKRTEEVCKRATQLNVERKDQRLAVAIDRAMSIGADNSDEIGEEETEEGIN